MHVMAHPLVPHTHWPLRTGNPNRVRGTLSVGSLGGEGGQSYPALMDQRLILTDSWYNG